MLVWAAESPQIHTACDYNSIDCCLTLIESEYFLMLVKKYIYICTHTHFIRYTLSILDYLLFSELPHSSWPILNKALETVSADLLTEISSKTNLILALWYGALSCWEWPSEDKYTAVIKKLIWDGSMPSCYLHQVLNKHENIANEIKTH